MQEKVTINKKLTFQRFGYLPKTLAIGSHQPVVVECKGCNRVIEREYRNVNRTHQCPVIEGNKKRCFKCKTWKDLSLFNKCPKLSGGVAKMCRECYNKHDAVIKCEQNRKLRIKQSFKNDFDFYLKRRSYSIRNHAKRNNIPCDLDAKFLLELWQKQSGRCYYSGLLMEAEGKINGFQGWISPSLDRKTPELGYVKDNVVWCCFSINSFKQGLTEKEFLDKLKQITWKDNN